MSEPLKSKDLTAAKRQQTRTDLMRKQGAKRICGWLSKEQADKLEALVKNGYELNNIAAIGRAIEEAFKRKKGNKS